MLVTLGLQKVVPNDIDGPVIKPCLEKFNCYNHHKRQRKILQRRLWETRTNWKRMTNKILIVSICYCKKYISIKKSFIHAYLIKISFELKFIFLVYCEEITKNRIRHCLVLPKRPTFFQIREGTWKVIFIFSKNFFKKFWKKFWKKLQHFYKKSNWRFV